MNQLKQNLKYALLWMVFLGLTTVSATAQDLNDGPDKKDDCCHWDANLTNLFPINNDLSVVIGYGTPFFSSAYKLSVKAGNNQGGIYGRAEGKYRAVYGFNSSASGWAGYFYGRTHTRSLLVNATTQPYSWFKAYVNGTLGAKGLDVVNSASNSGWGNQLRWIKEGSGIRHVITDDLNSGNLLLYPGFSGGAKRQVEVNGDMSIGTSAEVPAGFRLAVKDGIITEEVKVELCGTSGWCDYVFEKEYDLLPLTKVKAHIEEHGHLHKTPSAAEVEANGLLLKEMTINQQEKIEELFLHMIEMNEKVENLLKENKKLQKQNAALQTELTSLKK